MRTRDGTTWRDLAAMALLIGILIGMIPFLMLLVAPPPESINRPFLWVLFGVSMLTQSILFSWAMFTERPRPPASEPPPNLRRERIVYLEDRRRTRDALQRRLARIREAG